MKIAVISDIHDCITNLQLVIDEINTMEITHIVCCGDLCSPFIARMLGEKLNGDIYTVFGNTYDKDANPKVSEVFSNFHHMGDVGEIEIDGKSIGIIHYPEIARTMAEGGKYDFVFHGHNHTKNGEMIGDCLLLNPGELLGYRNPPSYAIVDLETKEYNFILL